MAISTMIYKLRIHADMSQEQFAELLGEDFGKREGGTADKVFLSNELPYSAAFAIQEEKYNIYNWEAEHGYYSMGLRDVRTQDWQTGWGGALAVIEPENALYLAASTAQAYDKEENRFLHVGQTLYLKHNNEEGMGRITSIDGANYIVEILEGDFELRDTVRCYRKSEMKNDEETGRGTVARYADTTVQAQGRITAVHVKEGDQVNDGDLLFEVVDATSKPFEPLSLTAPADGALSQLYVTSGMQVYRGQLLCEIANLNALELSVEVDEMDLDGLRVGDTLSYALDAYPGQTFSGTVKEIRPLGMPRQNASYFDVRLSIHSERSILPGMNGTVTLGK